MAELSRSLHDSIKKFQEIEAASQEKNNADFYFVVVFKDNKASAEF